uniref:Uncharacterized protein n=1 Tax=Arundo donax TaxID=35708 RepID=A0A0A9HKP8_ARUDO
MPQRRHIEDPSFDAAVPTCSMWLVAKCSSRPSQERVQPLVITPALLIRMLRGRLRDSNSEANLLTEAMELRSSSSTSTFAPGILARMASLAASPAETLRTATTTCTPRSARTRSVSNPMPLDAPAPPVAQHNPMPRPPLVVHVTTSVLLRLGAASTAATPSVSRTTGSSSTVVASATSPYWSREVGSSTASSTSSPRGLLPGALHLEFHPRASGLSLDHLQRALELRVEEPELVQQLGGVVCVEPGDEVGRDASGGRGCGSWPAAATAMGGRAGRAAPAAPSGAG